jgi:ATP-dependent Clp protease ATP-binding subunit ClpB
MFRNCVVIMTSNVGADLLSKEYGKISKDTRKAVVKRFTDLKFPLEFLNRIEEIVMFVSEVDAFSIPEIELKS